MQSRQGRARARIKAFPRPALTPAWVLSRPWAVWPPLGFTFLPGCSFPSLRTSLSSLLSPIWTTQSPPPTSKRRRSAAPSAHAPRLEAQFRVLNISVRLRRAAQSPPNMGGAPGSRAASGPAHLLTTSKDRCACAKRMAEHAHRERKGGLARARGRTGSGSRGSGLGRKGGGGARSGRAGCVCAGGGRPAEAERARARGFPTSLAAAATASLFREEKRDAHSVPDPSWRVGGGARKVTAPVPPGKEWRLPGGTRLPGLGEDGLNEAEAPGGGGGSWATRAGSGYGGA